MPLELRVYSDEEVQKRLAQELPHWWLEAGTVRRTRKISRRSCAWALISPRPKIPYGRRPPRVTASGSRPAAKGCRQRSWRTL